MIQRGGKIIADGDVDFSGKTVNFTGSTITGFSVDVTGGGVYADSIEDMVSLVLSDGTKVQCLGYYALGDGYTGVWEYDSSVSGVTDYGSFIPHNVTGGFWRVFNSFDIIKASEFGIMPNPITPINSARLEAYFDYCELVGAEYLFDQADKYIIPSGYSHTISNHVKFTAIKGAIITSYTGSNFAHRLPDMVDVTTRGEKLQKDNYYIVRETGKDAILHSDFAALAPIPLNQYLYKNGSGVWSKVNASTLLSNNYMLPIDCNYRTGNITYTNGSNTITSTLELKVGDVIDNPNFPSGTIVEIRSGSGTSWTATLNNDAISTGTSSANMYQALPTLDGYYIVEGVPDNYTGALAPRAFPQFTESIEGTHGTVLQRSSGVWSVVTFPDFIYNPNAYDVTIEGVAFDSIAFNVVEHLNGSTSGNGAQVNIKNCTFKNFPRMDGQTLATSPASGYAFGISGILGERLNPTTIDTYRIENCTFQNIGQHILMGKGISNIFFLNNVVQHTSTMLCSVYTVVAANFECHGNKFLNMYRMGKGMIIRGGQDNYNSSNNVYYKCIGICEYASGRVLNISNTSIDSWCPPYINSGDTPLLVKGGNVSLNYAANITNVSIFSLYASCVAMQRESDTNFTNCTFHGRRDIVVNANTELDERESGTGDIFNIRNSYQIEDAAGLSRFETAVSVNLRDTTIVVGDRIFWDMRINQWVKNIWTTSDNQVFNMGSDSHYNKLKQVQITDCILEAQSLIGVFGAWHREWVYNNCLINVNFLDNSIPLPPNTVSNLTMNGGIICMTANSKIQSSVKLVLNETEIRKIASAVLTLESSLVELNGVRLRTSTDSRSGAYTTAVLNITANTFRAYGVISDTLKSTGVIYNIVGATELDIQGGSVDCDTDGVSTVMALANVSGVATINKLIVKGVNIDYKDVATRRVLRLASDVTLVNNATIRDNSYIISPTTEISCAGSTNIQTYKSVGNDHEITVLGTLTNANVTTIKIANV